MTPHILADGTDSTVAVIWVVFVVLLVVLVVLGVVALRRYNANKQTLRSEGLGPLGAAAQRLGALADRPANADEPSDANDEPPTGPDDVEQRLREITELHDRGILDDDEFQRQRARMLEP
jgi:putative oligomerization/nucleic acid binding protein